MELKTTKIWFLHALRGVAALLVMIYHLAFLFWLANDKVTLSFSFLLPRTSINTLAYAPIHDFLTQYHFDLGAFGVALFFLISGFVIPISLERDQGVRFLISRFFRIYPTYIVGFTLTFLAILLYTRTRGIDFPYGIKNYLAQISLFRDWLWLPSIDGVSWTLETEIKFYLLVLVIASFKKLNSAKTIILIALSLCFLNIVSSNYYDSLLNNNIRAYQIIYVITYSIVSLLFMLIGVAFYNFHFKKWSAPQFWVVSVIVFLCFVAAFLNGPTPNLVKMYAFTYIPALLVFTAAYILRDSFKYNKWLNFLGDISYPLYVIHGLNGYMLLTILDGSSVNPYLSLAFTALVVIGISYILHRLVEDPSNQLGKNLAGKIKVTI